ncbi:MAG: hypothetical protein IIZ83_04990, partial [Oscillospiraceae bacterium]|nr:hypothetical protein [Oscillospiraceae bacterium]
RHGKDDLCSFFRDPSLLSYVVSKITQGKKREDGTSDHSPVFVRKSADPCATPHPFEMRHGQVF